MNLYMLQYAIASIIFSSVSLGEAGGIASQKTKSIVSAGKFQASVLWHVKGIPLVGCIEKGRTITCEYYSNLF